MRNLSLLVAAILVPLSRQGQESALTALRSAAEDEGKDPRRVAAAVGLPRPYRGQNDPKDDERDNQRG